MRYIYFFSMMLFVFFMVSIPLLLIDSGIIFFFENTYPSNWMLLAFLVSFYIANFLLELLLDPFKAIIENKRGKQFPSVVQFIIDFLVVWGLIVSIDSLFKSVTLDFNTHLFISLAHALIGLLIEDYESQRKNKLKEALARLAAFPDEAVLLTKQSLTTLSIDETFHVVQQQFPHLSSLEIKQLIKDVTLLNQHRDTQIDDEEPNKKDN